MKPSSHQTPVATLTTDASLTSDLPTEVTRVKVLTPLMIFFLGCFMWFSSLSTDMYLPAYPEIKALMPGHTELTLASFLAGFSIGQLVWGPISDKLGRKLPLVLGMIIYALASYLCGLATSLNQLILFRVLQAVGACTGPMLARAIVRDVYDKRQAARVLSILVFLMAVAPIMGPFIGALVLKVAHWPMIFFLQGSFGLVMVLTIFYLPETRPVEYIKYAQWHLVWHNYTMLFKHWQFMRFGYCIFAYYIAIYTFISMSSFVYIEYFGLPATYYGAIFFINNTGVIILSLANRSLVKHFSIQKILRVSTAIAATGGIWLMYDTLTDSLGIYGVIIPCIFFFAMNGIVIASVTALGLDKVPQIAGSGAAVLGFMQYSSGVVSAILSSIFFNNTPVAMGVIMCLGAVVCALLAFGKDKDGEKIFN